MRRKILNNLGLKLLSVVLAIVFWFLVVMADNPKDSVAFSNIQVNLINTELLEKGNKFYEVLRKEYILLSLGKMVCKTL